MSQVEIGPRIGARLRARVATRYRPLPDRRAPEALPPGADVYRQVDDESEPGVKVPPVEGPGERQLYWLAAVPVQDASYEHVQGDEEEQEV